MNSVPQQMLLPAPPSPSLPPTDRQVVKGSEYNCVDDGSSSSSNDLRCVGVRGQMLRVWSEYLWHDRLVWGLGGHSQEAKINLNGSPRVFSDKDVNHLNNAQTRASSGSLWDHQERCHTL